MYRVEVDFAPTYELWLSLGAFVNRPDHRLLDLGPEWVKSVEQQLQPQLASQLADPEGIYTDLVDLLIWMCPTERDPAGFITWLCGLSSGDLYDRLAPCTPDPLPHDLIGFRDRMVDVLAAWNEQYFRFVDPAIITGLEAEASEKRALVGSMCPVDLVELATNGLEFTPASDIELVLLVPQYHHRPWNVYAFFRAMRLFRYPADVAPLAAGEPPPSLLRVARTLGDDSRLRILRHVVQEPRTFTELVKHTGLAKSTVHHHMVALRAAGLVRVHDVGDKVVTYSLRPDAEDRFGAELRRYLR